MDRWTDVYIIGRSERRGERANRGLNRVGDLCFSDTDSVVDLHARSIIIDWIMRL